MSGRAFVRAVVLQLAVTAVAALIWHALPAAWRDDLAG
jgi:hypothetical protein